MALLTPLSPTNRTELWGQEPSRYICMNLSLRVHRFGDFLLYPHQSRVIYSFYIHIPIRQYQLYFNMNERFKQRVSSAKLPLPESRQPSPQAHRQQLTIVLSSLEQLFSRLQDTLEHQTAMIRNIEHGLANVVADKFDSLINVGVKLNENIVRLVGLTEKKIRTKTEERKFDEDYDTKKLDSIQVKRQQFARTSEINAISSKSRRNSIYRLVKEIGGVAQNSPERSSKQSQIPRLTTTSELRIVTSGFLSTPESVSVLIHQESKHQPHSFQSENNTIATIPPQISVPYATAIGYIKKTAGQSIITLAEEMYKEYSQGKMLHNELRANFSWKIMDFCMKFDQNFRKRCQQHKIKMDHHCWAEINSTMDTSLRSILEFLIKKYPPSKHKIIDTELAKHIKEVKRHGEIQYEVLRNAQVSFVDDKGKSNYCKQVKLWINKLIIEVKRSYPAFRNSMKQVFIGRENSSYEGANDQIEYEIGAKISENVELYSQFEIDSPGIKIKNTQIQRVLIKWVEQLKRTLAQPHQVISENKNGFKSKNRSFVIQLTTARKEELSKKIEVITKTKLFPIGYGRRRMLLQLVNQIIELVEPGVEGFEEFNMTELTNLKAAGCLSQSGQAFLVEMLNLMLQHLNLIRSEYSQDLLESGIDLITFNIFDMLRCRSVGNKKDIKRIYQTLIEHPEYEIIRVKNKLNESTRDILINFKPRNSFLVCQMQLALGDCKDEINDHFCHYFYELLRSNFPVIFEVASQVVSFDPRSSYFANDSHPVKFLKHTHQENILKTAINFNEGKISCSIGHPKADMNYHTNELPFCCSICSRFLGAYFYKPEYLRCKQCGVSICPRCILQSFPKMEESYILKYANYSKMHPFLDPVTNKVYCEFSTEKQMLPKIKEHLAKHQYLVVYIFAREGIKPYIVKLAESHIISTFFTLDGKILDFRDDRHETWNSILVLSPPEALKLSDLKGYAKLLNDDTPWHELEQLLERRGIDTVVGIRNEQSKEVLVVDVPQRPEEIHAKLQHQLMSRTLRAESGKAEATVELTSKDLTDLSVLNEIGNPATVRSLNLWGNRLTELPDMSAFTSLTELVLRENLINSIISGRFESLNHLKILNLQSNRLKSISSLKISQLQFLDLTRNQLTEIAFLSGYEYKCIQIIALSMNKLQTLPILNCPKLQVIFFVANEVTSLEEFVKGNLPKLSNIQGSKNKIRGALPVINFPELKIIHLSQNLINNIESLSTSELPLLETLTISKNSIVGSIPVIKTPNLKVLELAENKISNLQSIQKWEMPHLESLDLSGNAVAGKLAKMTLPKLRDAKFSRNAITDILKLSESDLEALQKLDFSSNKLTRLPLLSLLQLTELDLSDNCLESVDRLCQSRLPRLRRLTLSRNRLQGGLPDMDAPHLEELNLDDNDFSSLASLSHRHLLPALKTVSVKQNKKLAGNAEQITMDPLPFLNFLKRSSDYAIRHSF